MWSCYGSRREWIQLLWRALIKHPAEPRCSPASLPHVVLIVTSCHLHFTPTCPLPRTAHLPRIASTIFPLENISISILRSITSTRPFLQLCPAGRGDEFLPIYKVVNTSSVYWRVFSSKYTVFNMSVTFRVFIRAVDGSKDPVSNLLLPYPRHLAL